MDQGQSSREPCLSEGEETEGHSPYRNVGTQVTPNKEDDSLSSARGMAARGVCQEEEEGIKRIP